MVERVCTQFLPLPGLNLNVLSGGKFGLKIGNQTPKPRVLQCVQAPMSSLHVYVHCTAQTRKITSKMHIFALQVYFITYICASFIPY